MAATDVTYLYFQRDTAADNGPLSPVISSTRVIQHPQAASTGHRLRSGSVPPPSMRVSSQPPRGARAGSVTPSSLSRPSAAGISRHRTAGTAGTTVVRGVRADGTTGVVSGPVTLSTAGGDPRRRRRASISVIPAMTGTATARSHHHQQPIFRAESFLKSSATDGLKPASLTLTTSSSSSARRHRPTTTTTTTPTTSTTGGAGSVRRRSSVSLPGARQSVAPVSRSLSSSVTVPLSRAPPDTSAVKQDDLTTPAAVQAIFDKQLSKASLVDLRSRAESARDRLGRHRALIDRYLPLYMYLGPTDDVHDVVEYKVNELFDRVPRWDPNRSRTHTAAGDDDDDHVRPSAAITVVPPYQPLKPSVKLQPSYQPPPHVTTTFFTPKISDVRKRARSVLCKVKGDPHYFNL